MQHATERKPATLLIAFVDLTRYSAMTRRLADAELAEVIDGYYERIAAAVGAAGGRVVKFMGDGALLVFPATDVDAGVEALLALKDDIDAWMESIGWECRLAARAHVGEVIAGDFGGRFDVIGADVNTAAMLDHAGLALSEPAFRQLSPSLQARFKEHAPPTTYVRIEDPGRLRWDKR